jgi:hypothetical protein
VSHSLVADTERTLGAGLGTDAILPRCMLGQYRLRTRPGCRGGTALVAQSAYSPGAINRLESEECRENALVACVWVNQVKRSRDYSLTVDDPIVDVPVKDDLRLNVGEHVFRQPAVIILSPEMRIEFVSVKILKRDNACC